jgi:hypothetical protein
MNLHCRILVGVLLAGMSLPHSALADAPDTCKSESALDDANAKTRIVDAFPGEAIHLRTMHPDLCPKGTPGECRSKSWLLGGDRVLAGEDCDAWTLVEFVGKKTTVGWIASGSLYDPPMTEPVLAADSKSVDPICAVALKQLNDAAPTGSHGETDFFESAINHSRGVDKLPEGVGQGSPSLWGMSIGDASIQGHALKAVQYTAGGTCYDDSIELWDRQFKDAVDIDTVLARTNDENPDNDPANWGGYTRDSLSLVGGKPYFLHYSRGDHYIKMYGFASDLSTKLVCEFANAPRRPEMLRAATDRAVCEAASQGNIEPIDFRAGGKVDLSDTCLDQGGFMAGSSCDVLKPRQLDLYNDGKPVPVVMVSYHHDSSAGCGAEVNSDSPGVLGADGKLANDWQLHLPELASDTEGRLFRYQGTTYYETRSMPGAWNQEGIDHAIWKPSASSYTRICDFSPSQYVLVKPRPIRAAGAVQ